MAVASKYRRRMTAMPCVAALALVLSLLCVSGAKGTSAFAAWPALPRVIDAHVHLISLDNNISYTWGVAPLPNMSCPCVFPSGLPCLCPWTYAAYKNASQSTFPAPTQLKLVFVEVAAQPDQWLQEARWVQRLSGQDVPVGAIVAGAPQGFGVVGADDRQVAAALDQLVELPLARGIRAAALNFSDDGAFETIVKHTSMLAQRRLSLDIITAVQSPGVATAIAHLAAAVPNAIIILDHMGSPHVHDPSAFAPWAVAMAEIGKQTNVFVKIGGLLQYFKGDTQLPSAERMSPFVKTALRAFGFERSLFESNWFFINWPAHTNLYEYWLTALHSVLDATVEQQQHLFFRSAERAYRI